MKIATYNAASIRARMPLLLEWLAENEPDVVAVQETKVEDDKFPRADFEDMGYEVVADIEALPSRLPALYRRLTE